jgi:purine-binding chemotaxis protein CheW
VDGRTGFLLLARARSRICALPLEHVSETLRGLPLEAVPGVPPFVRGVSVLRGEPVPVVDLGALLGLDEAPRPTRLIAVTVGGRKVALAVEEVLRIVPAAAIGRRDLPPLLRGTGDGVVRSLAALDHGFLAVLEAGRLLPDEVWNAVAGSAS